MTHQPAATGTEDLDRALAQLLRQIEIVFDRSTSDLFELIEDTKAMSEIVSRLALVAGRERRNALSAAAATTEDYLEEVEQRFVYLAETAETLRNQAADLTRCLETQDRDLRLAAMISTNARVVSGTVPGNDGALSQFATDVKDLLTRTVRDVSRLRSDLVRADEKLNGISIGVREMVSGATTLKRFKDKLPALVTRIARDTSLDASARRAQSTIGPLTMALDSAVSHLQSGDSARQRFEHAREILARARDLPPDSRAPLLRLAAAQSDAALEDVRQAIASILPQLDRMAGAWSSVQAAMAAILNSGMGHALEEITDLTSGFTDGFAGLEAHRAAIGDEMSEVAELYGICSTTADSIADLKDRMNLLGLNAILVSGRCGQEGQAMMEVSRQLRDATSEVGKGIKRIVELAGLQELNAGLFATPGEVPVEPGKKQALESLIADVGELASALAAIASHGNRPEGAPVAARIRGRLEDFAATRLPTNHDIAASGSLPGADRQLAVVFDRIRTIYTMEAERRIHDSVLAGRECISGSGAAQPPETVDDVLFG